MKDWKDKYYASLESLEEKEKEWEDADQLLRRCLSRLTLASDGQGKRLDEYLERLRNTVRRERNYDRIQKMVDTIVEIASDLKQDTSNQLDARDVMLSMLEKLPFPEKLLKRKRSLQKKIDYMADDAVLDDEIKKLLELVSEGIQLGIDQPDSSEVSKKGLFGGVFGGSKKQQGVQEADSQESTESNIEVDDVIGIVTEVLADLLDTIHLPQALDERLEVIKQKTLKTQSKRELNLLLDDISRVVSYSENDVAAQEPVTDQQGGDLQINEIFIQLLERLDLPEDMIGYAESLKHKWETGLEEDQVVEALESIAELVVKIRTRIESEKNDFQAFLQQVTDRLQMLDQSIQENAESQQEIFDENKKFSDDVGGEVEQIQTDVRDANELMDLKTHIAAKLSNITTHVETFRDKEEKRKLQMEIRVGELAKKVSDLEDESVSLREKIVEEQQQAMMDALTKVPNRLAWDQRMDQEFGRWKRYETPLVVVVWDVDDFKKVNDTYGHKAGDKVLVTIATLLKDQVRETDFIARFGGEEFVMLLPETNINDAVSVVEKLRAGIEDCQFHHGEQRVPITVSGGMTQFKKGDTIEIAFERADQFLYKAKGSGKNRCCSELD